VRKEGRPARSSACRLAALGSCLSWRRSGRLSGGSSLTHATGRMAAACTPLLRACAPARPRCCACGLARRSSAQFAGTVADRVECVGWGGASLALPSLSLLPVRTDRDRLCAARCSASPCRQSSQAPRRACPPPCMSWSITQCTQPSASQVSTRPSPLGGCAEPGTRDAWAGRGFLASSHVVG
jgi:hypothetical protein